MHRSVRLLLTILLALSVAACDFIEAFQPPPDPEEQALTQTAVAATVQALETEAAPSATPSPSPAPSATPTPTSTPAPTPTPDLTATAIANCTGDFEALKDCLNETVLTYLMPEVEPERRLVDNADPKTLYSRPEVLEILERPETAMRHNVYARPNSCPLALACVLQTLLISFVSPEASQQFFDLVTGEGAGLPNETLVAVPAGQEWDDAKCAQGTRPSSQAGAPDPSALVSTQTSLRSPPAWVVRPPNTINRRDVGSNAAAWPHRAMGAGGSTDQEGVPSPSALSRRQVSASPFEHVASHPPWTTIPCRAARYAAAARCRGGGPAAVSRIHCGVPAMPVARLRAHVSSPTAPAAVRPPNRISASLPSAYANAAPPRAPGPAVAGQWRRQAWPVVAKDVPRWRS